MNRQGRYQGIDARAAKIVRFDRFHAARLREGIKAATTLHEINEAQLAIFRALLPMPAPANWLAWRLGLDPSYLWRTLRFMELAGHVGVCVSPTDRRAREVSLTEWGLAAARNLEWFEEQRARELLAQLPLREQERLVAAMDAIIATFRRDPITNLLECAREA
jgi:DNA-binding MarR family transcriptional regulator